MPSSGSLEMSVASLLDEIVGRVDGQKLGDVQRLLPDEAGRIADAAHGGIFDQRLDGGRPRHADMDREARCRLARSLLRPIGDGRRLEQELGGDEALRCLRLEPGLLQLQRLDQRRLAMKPW